jgi:hypothetical protein
MSLLDLLPDVLVCETPLVHDENDDASEFVDIGGGGGCESDAETIVQETDDEALTEEDDELLFAQPTFEDPYDSGAQPSPDECDFFDALGRRSLQFG